MRSNTLKAAMKSAILGVTILLVGAGACLAQQQVNLTAGPASLSLPDGSIVPMWGYSCGAPVIGSTAVCAQLNPAATGWSPVVITVPTGQGLTVNLTNNLSFGTTPNNVPTSLVIVGQLGGGLGNVTQRTTTPSPNHDNMGTQWPIANAGAVNTPPAQGPRVQSFSTEVATGTTTALTWTATNLRAGTYLMESGTHPSIQASMGLYGMLVVTNAPTLTAGTAYPGISYNADVRVLLSEIDPVQNNAVNTAVSSSGFSESATRGPYLGGPVASINLTGGGSGYTSAPTVNFAGGGGTTSATATAVVDNDSTSATYGQVTAINISTGGTYTSAPSISFSGGGGSGATATAALQLNPNSVAHCSGGASACYPPVVNYTPLYYLFNGVAFNKTNASTSLFAASPGTIAIPVTGNVLVRLVNAGLRMHVPAIVGSQTGTTTPVSGFSLIAEDGNPLPGTPRVQSEVFMAAGKTNDVMINVPAAGGAALPIYDRELSLSGNATARDAGMLAYLSVNGAGLPVSPAIAGAAANPDSYSSVIAGQTLTVSDPAKGVIANDINVYGVKVLTPPTQGTVTLNANGTFSYVPNAGWTAPDTFVYQANGNGPIATVTLNAATIEAGSGIVVSNITYTSNVATSLSIKSPGVLSVDKDLAGYPITVATSTVVPAGSGWTLSVDKSGGFNATVPGPGTYSFTYKAQNSQGTVSASSATVTLNFPTATGLNVKVVDGKDKTTALTDYRWIIEEDRTFYIDPTKTTNTGGTTVVPTFGTNFHTSYMPVVAQGCVGTIACESGQTVLGQAAVCDLGNGGCRTSATQEDAVDPSQVHLDPTKRYYISILPGDAANPFNSGNAQSGHGMGGAPIAVGQTAVTVFVQPTPFQTSKLSVFVFEDDFPLNGEQDAGGGIDVLATNEPGLGGFNITLFDDAGGSGDATGQMTYDMFNMPLSNSLAGTIDPNTGLDACPISKISRLGANDPTQTGITGTIVTCPKYEAGGRIPSPLAGQAVVANLMPGRYGVVATPGADRIGRGEEWLQTNTLDGQKAHDSFLRVGEPSFFQEYGPAGYHVSIGFANPKVINSRLKAVCNGTDPNVTGTNCTNSVKGMVTTERMSRTPDERLYSSGSNDSFAFTQCYVSFGDTDGEDFAFTKCKADGTFSLSGLPNGTWRVTVFDQWNDMLVDGLSTPVLLGGGKTTDMGQIAMNQWQANIYTKTFFDTNGDGVAQDSEPGLSLVATNIRFRDGSFSNFNNTDLSGNAGFNEVFPLFSWYVVETDTTRYKNTGTHVVYDAGGPADGTCSSTTAPCGNSSIGQFMANTAEPASVGLPTPLRVPGAVYCSNGDCSGFSIQNGPGSSATGSTGRIDPPWVTAEGWQGFSGQNSFIEFGKKPFATGENGGIHGHVVYASTRPFDDPTLLLQLSWEPLVPHVTINLYQEGIGPDASQTLKLVDTTQTSSWDDWAQGFRSDGVPNMNCPGQSTADLFYFTLFNQPDYLDAYNNGGTPAHTLPNSSQFKCYDGMHNWNQVQPAPYDGMYQFPSVTARSPQTGLPTATNCTICAANPTGDGTQMLPAGKYVVEVVVPSGYELVKEEDKNILIGDNYIAPVTQQFGGLGSIFILPDQAEVGAAYNANNAQNPTQNLGRTTLPSHEGDTGSIESYWPCVGQTRTVPDFISLFPQSQEVSPFAGATRNLCDRKEVTLDDQTSALAKFYIFTSTHAAAHFTGVITDDFTSEFDPFSPQFGEKFSPPNMPISIKDWTGTEISRVYSDQWGTYNGLTYSTWEVNPPNPTGYAPTMMITCMNDPGAGPTPDALFNPAYSQFCYEIPFMPGQTQYMDTPVVPTSAFSEGYNHPDCSYPDATPAISEVDSSDGAGPWVSAAGTGHTLTIHGLGAQTVVNNGYSGPSATTAPFNQKTVTRHYGFGTTPGTVALVGSDGVSHPLTSVSWSDTQITGTVPSGVPACSLQQQAQYGGSTAQCGELVIIRADNGKQSIDTVTVTIGGKAPTRVSGAIQDAIDAALPGDLLIVPPGTYNELLLMWKPVRLQGVGAASSVINANTHPAGKLDPWRAKVNCLFGLALNGQPFTSSTGGNPFDSTGGSTCGGWAGYNGAPNSPQVDRLPLEGIVGWDTTVNGNLAQLLQEPTLMGAYEGAAITVLAKGVRYPAGASFIFGNGSDTGTVATEGQFPLGTILLTANDCTTSRTNTANPFPSNFQCNPSSIDGLGITNSSQGGGGIFVHAWGHNLQIANNRVNNNTGTLTGGITVGQGESPDALLVGNNGDPISLDEQPWTCLPGGVVNGVQVASPAGLANNTQLPYCFNLNVNVHHNAITTNSSIGDELFSSTPAGAGGVSFCIGADYYKFNYNWVCGNLSTGDGGGVAHIGYIYNGDIEHNSILFNESTNPTVPTNGGGIIVMGAPPDGSPAGAAAGTECGSVTDVDCAPGLSDGTGPGLVINANVIMGNAAESGSGGGIRFQNVNGTEVGFFPLLATPGIPRLSPGWNSINVTNNIIANNVAGWDGAGVSLQDALVVNLINNTIISNDTTASSGVLFNTLGAPIASAPGSNCIQSGGTTKSCPQPAGLVTMQNTSLLTSSLGTVSCPFGHGTTGSACKNYSVPLLYNDVFWQNRSFYIGVGPLGTGNLNQQNVVALYNAFTNTQAASQPQADTTAANGNGVVITGGTGACVSPASYWDIGVRGDTGPTNHSSGLTLAPTYSVLTSTSGYGGANNSASNPTVRSQYCNGARTPPEFASSGYQVPPGISDATVPNPIFNLTPSATVDEGNNWINISWGPLAGTNPVNGSTLGNYSLAAGSPAINYIPSSAGGPNGAYTLAPPTDFFGTLRKTNGAVDAGAVEFVAGAPITSASVSPNTLAFGNWATGTTSSAKTVTVTNTGTVALAGGSFTITPGTPFSRPAGTAGGTCTAALAVGSSCTVNVVFAPTTATTSTSTLTVAFTGATVTPSTVALTGTGVAARAAMILSPNPLTITLPSGAGNITGTGTVTLKNNAAAGGAQVAVTNVTISGGNVFSFFFSSAGADNCTGATLAPQASCTVGVRFTNTFSARGTNRNGTITFTDNGAASPQTGALVGFATP